MHHNIVSFSGGKDSTAMLLMLLEKNIQIDRIIFIDTTKEFPPMYEHIRKVQNLVKPLKIEIFKIDFDYWFAEHVKTKGRLKGEKGYGWPDFQNRWCTALKRDTFIRAQNKFSTKTTQFHGIAFNEKNRADKFKDRSGVKIKYPLIEWNLTEEQTLKYCYSKGFNWDNLYEKIPRMGCWCCPLAREEVLNVVYNDFPELWIELERMDQKSFRQFKYNHSVESLRQKFAKRNTLLDLTSFFKEA